MSGTPSDPWQPPGSPGRASDASAPSYQPSRGRGVMLVAVLAAFVLGVGVTAVALREDPLSAGPTARPAPLPSSAAPKPVASQPVAAQPVASASERPRPESTYRAPSDGVAIRGRVVDASGRPVPDATVVMTQEVSAIEAFATAITALTSFGLACVTGICEVPYGQGRTDTRGEYVLFLAPATSAYTLTAGAGSSPTFTAPVSYRGRPLRLPDAVLWSPAPRLETSGNTARIRFAAAPRRLGSVEGYATRIGAGPFETVYASSDAHSGDTFDARLLEDATATLTVTARVHGAFGVITYAGERRVQGRSRPLSRGRTCLEYGKGSKVIRHSACALTDGDLFASWKPRIADFACGSSNPCERSVSVDLGSVRQIRYVVARTCDQFFDEITASTDGRTWRTLLTRDPSRSGDGVCAVEVSGTARYVRVTGPAGGFFTSRSEVSVFA